MIELSAAARATLAQVADHFIPAAHGMPSAADVLTDDRLRFVLNARPDLMQPLQEALRPELGSAVRSRLQALSSEPANLGALQLVIVAAYYTDKRVRELIGYPGQEAIDVKSWVYPPYLEEGLIDAVMARGPMWRDPKTGRRAVSSHAPMTYEERTWAQLNAAPEGAE